jgi:hypothetical protein
MADRFPRPAIRRLPFFMIMTNPLKQRTIPALWHDSLQEGIPLSSAGHPKSSADDLMPLFFQAFDTYIFFQNYDTITANAKGLKRRFRTK